MKAFTFASLLHCFILQLLSKLWDILCELCICLQIYMLNLHLQVCSLESRLLASVTRKHVMCTNSSFPSVAKGFCCCSSLGDDTIRSLTHCSLFGVVGKFSVHGRAVWFTVWSCSVHLHCVTEWYVNLFLCIAEWSLCCCVSLWFVVLCTLVRIWIVCKT